MGIGAPGLRFLLSAQRMGLTGTSVCTLGRQAFSIRRRRLRSLLRDYQRKPFSMPRNRAMYFVEDVLAPLGFTVDAIDASDYEGANIVHDLNLPVPAPLRERYDLVWDSGTLEHIFNFPVAMLNAMQMVKVGGHLFIAAPANNQCGHGFYQFSPELFFRILSPDNGFELLRSYIDSGGFYHVVDPAVVHGRVELLSCNGAAIWVHARKLKTVDRLKTPQQSDYISAWNGAGRTDGRVKGLLRLYLSKTAITRISWVLNRLRIWRGVWRWKTQSRLSNRKLYVPVTSWETKSEEVFRHCR
jgi:SAM-dependent methyltransferase